MGFARSPASGIMSKTLTLSAEQQQQSDEIVGRGGVSRGRYVVLQSLVGVMLGYQLLFGPEPIVSRVTSELIVGGLVLLITCLLAAPASLLLHSHADCGVPAAIVACRCVLSFAVRGVRRRALPRCRSDRSTFCGTPFGRASAPRNGGFLWHGPRDDRSRAAAENRVAPKHRRAQESGKGAPGLP